jgi:cytochrome c556
MKRTAAVTAIFAAACAIGAVADASDVKEIMGKANKPTGIYFNLARDLKDDEPAWADVQQQARDLAKLAAALRKATPPKGEKASWDALTKAYADNAVALAAAADKKDKNAAQTAHAKMGGDACMTCHKAHRPE